VRLCEQLRDGGRNVREASQINDCRLQWPGDPGDGRHAIGFDGLDGDRVVR
jgi:hypothetical protein